MSINSRFRAISIISERKGFYRQRIPEFSCRRKETVGIDILATSRNGGGKSCNKNPQSFPEIRPIQKEVLLSHKLQDHAYVPSQRNCTNQLSHQNLSYIKRECQESLS